MTKQNTIPKHWQIKKIGEVCNCVTGTTPPKIDSSNYGNDIPFVKPPQLLNRAINDSPEKLSNKGSEKARILPINSVLVTCIGNLGRTAINKTPVAFNQQINAMIPPKSINGRFLFYQAQSFYFQTQLKELSSATTVSIVNKSKFQTIKIKIPPLPEQQAIVAKIEELLSDLENGKQQLLTAQQQLKVYRQSLLKWAFEGKSLLPFEQFIEVSQNGLSKRSGTKGCEFKVLRLADIDNNTINVSNPRKILMDKNEIDKYKLLNNDLVCIRVNGSKDLVGRLVYVSKEDENNDWAFCDHFIRFKLESIKAFSKFYYYYFLTIKVRKYIHDNMVTSAGQNAVSQVTIKKILVPDCPIKEQLQIVQELESKLTVCDKIEETISQSLLQAESLKQSILKKAFEGKLV